MKPSTWNWCVGMWADNNKRHSAADEWALSEEHDTAWGEHGADDQAQGIHRAVRVTWTGLSAWFVVLQVCLVHTYTNLTVPQFQWQFGAVGSDVGQINKVTLCRARLILYGWPYQGSTPDVGNLSQSNQPPRSTQPGHPSVGKRNEYRPKGSDALRLGVKTDMVLFAGNTVWSMSERVRGVCVDALYKSTYTLLYFTSSTLTLCCEQYQERGWT